MTTKEKIIYYLRLLWEFILDLLYPDLSPYDDDDDF